MPAPTASTRTTEQELLSLIRNSAGSETDDLASQLEGGGRDQDVTTIDGNRDDAQGALA